MTTIEKTAAKDFENMTPQILLCFSNSENEAGAAYISKLKRWSFTQVTDGFCQKPLTYN